MSDPSFPLEPSAAELDAATSACVEFIREHVLSLPEQPSFDLDGADRVCALVREPVPEKGSSLAEILPRLRLAVSKSFNTAGPGYLAFIPGGGLYASALADFIACATNRYVGVNRPAPALAEIERTVIDWLATLMGYPSSARGILTSGGSMSNLVALVTARTERLGEALLCGTIYVSEETHLCIAKAARFAGFPERNVRRLPVDSRFRLDPASLERAIVADRAAGMTPFLLVANVGSTNTGAVDPVPRLVEIAKRHGLWVHADAAYGGFFRLVDGGEALVPGLELCDSITLDPHKGLFLPYGTGCLLVRDGVALRRTHRTEADYLQDVSAEGNRFDFTDLSPELSRDFRGLRLWLPMKMHGLAAFKDQLREKLNLARLAHDALAADSLFEMLDEPQLSVVAFRMRPRGGDADAMNAQLLGRVNARRRVFLSSTRIRGSFVLRICVLSFRTHRDRVLDAVAALREEARAIADNAPP